MNRHEQLKIPEVELAKMRKNPIEVTQHPHCIEPDTSRVISRFFGADEVRTGRIIKRAMTLSDREVAMILRELKHDFTAQHRDIGEVWLEHFARVEESVPSETALSDERKLLIGAYFTMDYAVEAAALFNPSIVPSLEQNGLPPGSTRFLMSLRATGEGHVSSIVFRRGVIDKDNNIIIETKSPVSRAMRRIEDAEYETAKFRQRLADVGALSEFAEGVLSRVGERFTLRELGGEIERTRQSHESPYGWEECKENMLCLALSNSKLVIPADAEASEMVIFPSSENESQGIEDLRLVQFTDDDGSVRYYGTYSAYNGHVTFPTLLETRDFKTIEIRTIYGRCAKNKGMALFPRKIGGKYVMSGRLDGENLYILESDNVYVWNRGKMAEKPKYWWEMVIIGNCGSPLETEEGWLLLTHGVGPMRQYFIGVTLLDLDDPTRVLGRTKQPLIVPSGPERIGYVPNVVYTCGAMIHGDRLIIPYSMSDVRTTFASVSLPDLLDLFKRG
ncbi:MAG: glycoside hydrolase family 130 protein [Candidatus Dadabacteria bacterium]|nr:glycoside hydrolase family 130 protein [Candidatus Dadabacteria bacterium]